MSFSPDTLTKKREALGISTSELALRTGINRSILNRIERGFLTPYPNQLNKIRAALNEPGSHFGAHQ